MAAMSEVHQTRGVTSPTWTSGCCLPGRHQGRCLANADRTSWRVLQGMHTMQGHRKRMTPELQNCNEDPETAVSEEEQLGGPEQDGDVWRRGGGQPQGR